MVGLKTGQRRDVRGNVVTFGATSRHSREDICQRRDIRAQRRDVPEDITKQRHDVAYQRRDVPETANNQRRDVDNSHHNVPKALKINVATLQSHVTTCQRSVKMTSRRWDVTTLKRRDVATQRRDVTEKASKNLHIK